MIIRKHPQCASQIQGLHAVCAIFLEGLVLSFFGPVSPIHAASPITHINSTSELASGRGANSVYHLVDGESGTLWCSRPSPADEKIRISFRKKETLSQLTVQLALDKTGAVDTSRVRPKFLVLSDGQTRREMRIRNQSTPQIVKLQPVIRSKRIIVSFPVLRAASEDNAPLCLDALIIKSKSGELEGKKISSSYQELNRTEKASLGTWVDDPSAPQRILDLQLDGKYTFTYTPLLDGSPVSHRGKWSMARDRLILERKKDKLRMVARMARIDDGLRQVKQLQISAPDKKYQLYSASFRQEPFPSD